MPSESKTTEPSKWAQMKAYELAKTFQANSNGMIDNFSIRKLATALDETLKEGEALAYAKRNLKL